MTKVAWVIMRYINNGTAPSEFGGIVGVYATKTGANDMLDLLNNQAVLNSKGPSYSDQYEIEEWELHE